MELLSHPEHSPTSMKRLIAKRVFRIRVQKQPLFDPAGST
jgi:hypothetical protein